MIFSIRRFALLLTGLGIIMGHISAQGEHFNDPWRWVQFTTEAGLPSNSLVDVLEAGDSTVWAVTMAGLSWYDGFRWNVIDSTKGLPAGYIGEAQPLGYHQILISLNHRLYVGDRKGFVPLSGIEATEFAPIDSARVLFQRQSSLFIIKGGVTSPFQPSARATDGKTIAIWGTKGGAAWANLSDGIYRLSGNEWEKKIAYDSSPGKVAFLEENAHGSGIAYLSYPFSRSGIWEWYNHSEPLKNIHERPDNITAIDMSQDDEAVVSYQSGDVKIRQHGVWTDLPLMNSEIHDIRFVKFRKNDDLWIGTDGGLFLYKRSTSRWRFVKHESPDLRNYANELLQTHDGDLWVATSDGIEIHHPDSSIRTISQINNQPLFVVTGLAEDEQGGVWVSSGSSFEGAYRWDGSRWTHYEVGGGGQGIHVHKIRKDRQGRLWFLGMRAQVLSQDVEEPGAFVYTGGSFSRWGVQEGLINGRVYSFAEGNDGTFWFGTGGGLSRWKPRHTVAGVPDVKNGIWTHWTLSEGLRTKRVFALTVDSTGRLWFGDPSTLGMGVGYIDRNDSVHYMTVADGLVNDYIWDLRVDSSGTLWVATGDGLCNYANGQWSTFDRESGLQHSSLWPVLPLGRQVYVGTQGGGVAILDVDQSSTPPPRIELDLPTIRNNAVSLRWRTLAYWGELDPSEIMCRYRLYPGEWSAWSRGKECTFVDLRPGDYTYQVQARGLFGNYLPEGARGSFTVQLPMMLRPVFLLPVGILMLAVLALGVVLAWRKRRHDIELRKSEEQFRTVTEMTSSAILIYKDFKILFANGGAEHLTGSSRAELLRMTYPDLFHPVLRDEIRREESRFTDDKLLPRHYEARLITRAGEERWVDCTTGWIHFHGNPVRLATVFDITGRKQSEEKLRSLASELSLTEERERRRMATYLHDVIGQTLALSKMKIGGLQKTSLLPPQNQILMDIRDLIDQSITNTQTLTFELCPPILYELSFEAAVEWLAERMEHQHGLSIEFHDDGQAKQLAEEMRVLLFQAIRELIINIIKHAGATHACVSIALLEDSIKIEIADNGKGFDATKKSEGMCGGGGFGLFNIRERLSHLGAKLDVVSAPGEGTTVTIVAPIQLAKTGGVS